MGNTDDQSRRRKSDKLNFLSRPDTSSMSLSDVKIQGCRECKLDHTAARSSTYVKVPEYTKPGVGQHRSPGFWESSWNKFVQMGHRLDKAIFGDPNATDKNRSQPAGALIWGSGLGGWGISPIINTKANYYYPAITFDGINSNFGSKIPVWGALRSGRTFSCHPIHGITRGILTNNQWKYWGTSAYTFSKMLDSSVPSGIDYIWRGKSEPSRPGSLFSLMKQDFRQDFRLTFQKPDFNLSRSMQQISEMKFEDMPNQKSEKSTNESPTNKIEKRPQNNRNENTLRDSSRVDYWTPEKDGSIMIHNDSLESFISANPELLIRQIGKYE